MFNKEDKNAKRLIRHARVRKNLAGTADRPRLCVYRSNSHIYAQIIDDDAGNTLVSASTMDGEIRAEAAEKNGCDAARLVGETVARRALDKGITTVVFDRGGYLYTGRVAAVAEGARKGGLAF